MILEIFYTQEACKEKGMDFYSPAAWINNVRFISGDCNELVFHGKMSSKEWTKAMFESLQGIIPLIDEICISEKHLDFIFGREYFNGEKKFEMFFLGEEIEFKFEV